MLADIPHNVTATQLVRDLAAVRNLAAQGAVAVSSHNRVELVLMRSAEYADLVSAQAGPDKASLEAKLTTVLDSIDTRVGIFDRDLNVRRINRAFRLVLGLPSKSFVGEPMSRLFKPEIAPFLSARLREVLDGGKPAEFDFASILNPGRTMHARIVPWPGGVAYFADDITDRLAAIEQGLEYRALRDAIAGLGRHAIGTLAADGTIRSACSGLAALTGADPAQLEGRRFISLFDPDDREQILEALGRREGTSTLVVRFHRGGAGLSRARVVFSPYLGGKGNGLHAFAMEELAFPE